jgi:hypothetical protein
MAKTVPKSQIDSVVRKNINTAVRAVMFGTTYPVDRIADFCVECVEQFLYGKVHDARVVLYGRTPMTRVSIRYGNKSRSTQDPNPLGNLIGTFPMITGTSFPISLQNAILPLLPQDLVAMKMADIKNAIAQVLLNPKKTAKVKAQIIMHQIADKERLIAQIRRAFSDGRSVLTEADVVQLWRECLVGDVMDS